MVAQALNAECKGEKQILLPKVKTTETLHLITAFSEMRKQVHERQVLLEYQALHDSLTGLPNRTYLLKCLIHDIQQAAEHNQRVALLLLALDRFKEINDTLGHHVGDQVLKNAGKLLLNFMSEHCAVARLGGDEFAFVLNNVADEKQIFELTDKILQVLEKIDAVEDYRIYIGGSIGIAYYPDHGQDAHSLIQRADVAMYDAKSNRSRYAIYDINQDQYSITRLSLVRDLRTAIDAKQLELHFQPKSDVATGMIVGAEALLRWEHPDLGYVPTEKIIQIAEQTGLIKPLTQWVIDAAIRQCAKWLEKGVDIGLSVNLSARNLHDPELSQYIQACLQNWKVPSHRLELEVTESIMMADPMRAIQILSELDAMGIRIAVDDFGTGFSSLAYLKRLPVDTLKIHQSFVMEMASNDNDRTIVRSTIDLAHNLGLEVVAEGVQDHATLKLLEQLGCDMAQGFCLSRPLSAPAFNEWLASRQCNVRRKPYLVVG
jgi:diguanylate cyclase (GGDEF)-like protein